LVNHPEHIPFSWLKNCLDQHHPDRKNIKRTSAIFAHINLQCKLLKDQKILAKETENMFTGSSADQQRKDASAARYPTRSTLHSIPDSSNVSSPSAPMTPSLPADGSHEDSDVIPATTDEFSFQDEAEDIASTSYDNSATTAIVLLCIKMSLINHHTGFFYDLSVFCHDIVIFCYDHVSCILNF